MAQAQPDQFLNVVALAIIIMPFLTTEALERLDDWENDRRPDYMRVATLFALFLAFFITVLVAALVLNIAGQSTAGCVSPRRISCLSRSTCRRSGCSSRRYPSGLSSSTTRS